MFRLYQDSHREKPSRERQEFFDMTLLEIRNYNQESTIPSLNMNIKHRKKKAIRKELKNVVISDFVEPNAINYVERTLKQHGKKFMKLEF